MSSIFMVQRHWDLRPRMTAPIVVNEVDPMSLVLADGMMQTAGPPALVESALAQERPGYRAAGIRGGDRVPAGEPLGRRRRLGADLGRRIRAVPNGVAPRAPDDRGSPVPGASVFRRRARLSPNVESAVILARDVLPVVRRRVPGGLVVLAGRAACDAVRSWLDPMCGL